jgi:hypothetical protein
MLHDPKREALAEEELFHAGLKPWQQAALDAASLLKKRGWIQSDYESPYGYCVVGAFQRVGTSDSAEEASHQLWLYLDCDLAVWNDNRNRTAEDVIHVLQLVALG